MAEQTKLWYLKNFDFFEGMDDATMEQVNGMASMNSVAGRQPIPFPDHPSRTIFLLKQGHVKISRIDGEGREIILDIVGPGELFGELALLQEGEAPSEIAQALDDAIVCAVRIEDFEQLLRVNPELNFRISKRIGFRLRKFEERVTDLVFKDVRRRIAGFLLKLAQEFGRVREGVVTIRMHLSHQEIGLLTGSARQTVTSTLNDLRSEGVIDFSRKSLTIADMQSLRRIAG